MVKIEKLELLYIGDVNEFEQQTLTEIENREAAEKIHYNAGNSKDHQSI
jgi:hypothetical protein